MDFSTSEAQNHGIYHVVLPLVAKITVFTMFYDAAAAAAAAAAAPVDSGNSSSLAGSPLRRQGSADNDEMIHHPRYHEITSEVIMRVIF
jgi:hypothetical protein